jgi:two-component system response regulator AtoC
MRIAVIDDESIVRNRLQTALEKQGYTVSCYASGEDLLSNLQDSFDLVFLDMMLPGMNGIEALKHIKSRSADTEVILITGYASIDSVVEAIKLGAFHYLAKPLRLEEIKHLAAKALERKGLLRENRALKSRLEEGEGWGEMIGVSPEIKQVFTMISKIAPLDCNVLIQGESGTGKELVARLIHRESRRKDHPFVAFNCGVFTQELIGSELFGYERGAFTGATATKLGILETAHGGTVLMDEIGDIPLPMQGKLLRVLQERQIMRVGANKPIQLDLRFIAASNKDLKRAVKDGRFREDLYFRLNVVQIDLPNLAERKQDIPVLISFFMRKYSHKFSKKISRIDPEAQEILEAYTYPGNIRELENIIERAVALTEGDTLSASDLPQDLRELSVTAYGQWPTLEDKEREYLRKVLQYTGHNLGQTAEILDVPRTTLWRKMKKFGFSAPSREKHP